MPWAIDWGKLGDLFLYDPGSPLIFSSGLFLFLFLAFILVYGLFRRTATLRTVYLTAFSLYFYYKTGGWHFLLLVAVATSDFFIAQGIFRSRTQRIRKLFLALSICVNLGLLCYYKYTNFLIDIVNGFLKNPLDFQYIFLPVGISFFIFQSMSYTIDVYRRRLEPLRSWLDYVFYISFFPQLVAGPIVRAVDFVPQIRQNPIVISRRMFNEGFVLILGGLFKKAVISDYISANFVDRVFDNPTLFSGVENLFGVYGYAMQIYCDFSGYSDMAIGLALLLGFRFNRNFDSPYKSASITEFWRRWHISLSTWLKDYLYISLGGNRKGHFRTYLNQIMTMLLGGLWHGASVQFVLWGALHGVSLAAHKFAMNVFPSFRHKEGKMPPWRRFIGTLVTFHLVCLGWVFFRARSAGLGMDVLRQIFSEFHPGVFGEFIAGYKWIVIVIAIGYLLHFMPLKVEQAYQRLVGRLPLAGKAVMMAALIWFVMQIKSADIQPFIYFQF